MANTQNLLTMSADMQLEIEPEALAIPAYAAIVNRDTTKRKELAKQELAYVWFCCSMASHNPYKNEAFAQRTGLVAKDIMPKDWKPDKLIFDAIQYYRQDRTTLSLLLEDAKVGIQKLREYFRTVDLRDLDNNGKPIYSAKDLMANLEKLGKVVESIKKLEEAVKAEMQDYDDTIRGGGELGLFEAGIIE